MLLLLQIPYINSPLIPYEHIIDLYDKYEKILEQNGMTNGRVTASMEFVLKNYQDLMDNGFKK